MKKTLFIPLLVLAAFTKAQDSSFCYIGGIAASKTVPAFGSSAEQKNLSSLILMPYVMNEKEVMKLLKEKKSSSVQKLLRKIKFSKNMSLIGFAAIPAGIIGTLSVVEASKSHAPQSLGLGFIALGAVSLSSGFYFNHERKMNYKKAIATYNQIYD